MSHRGQHWTRPFRRRCPPWSESVPGRVWSQVFHETYGFNHPAVAFSWKFSVFGGGFRFPTQSSTVSACFNMSWLRYLENDVLKHCGFSNQVPNPTTGHPHHSAAAQDQLAHPEAQDAFRPAGCHRRDKAVGCGWSFQMVKHGVFNKHRVLIWNKNTSFDCKFQLHTSGWPHCTKHRQPGYVTWNCRPKIGCNITNLTLHQHDHYISPLHSLRLPFVEPQAISSWKEVGCHEKHERLYKSVWLGMPT